MIIWDYLVSTQFSGLELGWVFVVFNFRFKGFVRSLLVFL